MQSPTIFQVLCNLRQLQVADAHRLTAKERGSGYHSSPDRDGERPEWVLGLAKLYLGDLSRPGPLIQSFRMKCWILQLQHTKPPDPALQLIDRQALAWSSVCTHLANILAINLEHQVALA
eukprot:1290482-Rhodomonas_salina.1